VKQSDLGEYEENAREKVKYTIYRKAPTPPQTKPYGWQTPISPRKSVKREASRGLVKISANCLLMSMYLISMSPLYMISQEVVSSLNMSHLFVED
jgi:hypothetical protein